MGRGLSAHGYLGKASATGSAAFYWFNTHFDAFSPWARARSAVLLRDRINHIAGAMPCVVTGDFNSPTGSKPYHTLLAPQPNARSL